MNIIGARRLLFFDPRFCCYRLLLFLRRRRLLAVSWNLFRLCGLFFSRSVLLIVLNLEYFVTKGCDCLFYSPSSMSSTGNRSGSITSVRGMRCSDTVYWEESEIASHFWPPVCSLTSIRFRYPPKHPCPVSTCVIQNDSVGAPRSNHASQGGRIAPTALLVMAHFFLIVLVATFLRFWYMLQPYLTNCYFADIH